MSHRQIKFDPIVVRKEQYKAMEIDGSSQRALWKAIEAIDAAGLVVFPEEVQEQLEARKAVKARAPKN